MQPTYEPGHARGCRFICRDTRGRNDSDGAFYPFVFEAGDGPE